MINFKKIILCISIFISFSAQAQKVEIKSSRLHGLLIYVFSNAGSWKYSPYLKEMTDQSEYKDQMQKIFLNYAAIEKSLNQALNYRQSIKGYGDGFGVDELFETQSAFATDIDDLFIRLQNTMPTEDLLEFKNILKAVRSKRFRFGLQSWCAKICERSFCNSSWVWLVLRGHFWSKRRSF